MREKSTRLHPLKEARARILKLEAHLHKIVLILEKPIDKKNLHKELNSWFEQTKIIITEN